MYFSRALRDALGKGENYTLEGIHNLVKYDGFFIDGLSVYKSKREAAGEHGFTQNKLVKDSDGWKYILDRKLLETYRRRLKRARDRVLNY